MTFPAAIDTGGVLTDAFGLDVVRAVLLLDERGVLVRPALRIDVDAEPDLVSQIAAWLEGSGPVPGDQEPRQRSGAGMTPARASGVAWYRIAEMALAQGDREGAVAALDEAWTRLPDNLQLRKQRWALREPDRFYTGDIDFDWQDEQRALGH